MQKRIVPKLKWQKDFAKKVKALSDEEFFDFIHKELGDWDRFIPRNFWQEEYAVQQFKKRMGLINC